MKKALNIIISVSFFAAIFAMFLLNVLSAPEEFSASERRRLAQFPPLSAAAVLNGKFMEGFEDYAVDQAAFRGKFRRLKAEFDFNVLRKLDNNKIFVIDNMVFKTEYPLNEPSIKRLSGIINSLYDGFPEGIGNVYYTIVPDKNAYLLNSNHLILNYGKMKKIARESLAPGITYIDIFDELSLFDYFRTDSHWRQERLGDVALALAKGMSFELAPEPYTKESFDRFYGVYYGQSALNIDPDELVWLVNDTTRNTIVTSAEKPGEILPVYDLLQLDSVDPYSLFMCGPAALVTAENPANDSGRELIIFRDSYASSLAPLLLSAYSRITMIDLRYMTPDQIGQFVEYLDQDVLFIYSATLFNTSDSIRSGSAAFISPFTAKGRLAVP